MHIVRALVLPTLLAFFLVAPVAPGRAQVLVNITVAPPPLPVYVQPAIPGPNYIWTPGYWSYGPLGYYWVPGTWVLSPAVGLLWTPGYWGWSGGYYVWRAGYWGPRIGYYGGINYGYGYGGIGFQGGYWSGGVFSYNRSVTNIGSTQITNVYTKTVVNTTNVSNTTVNNTTVNNTAINNTTNNTVNTTNNNTTNNTANNTSTNNTNITRASYNGGTGGTTAQPTVQEKAAAQDPHTPATATQVQHQTAASNNRALLASVNKGKPAVAATTKPGQFAGPGVVAAKGAPVPKTNAAIARNPNKVASANRPPGRPQPRKPLQHVAHTPPGPR